MEFAHRECRGPLAHVADARRQLDLSAELIRCSSGPAGVGGVRWPSPARFAQRRQGIAAQPREALARSRMIVMSARQAGTE